MLTVTPVLIVVLGRPVSLSQKLWRQHHSSGKLKQTLVQLSSKGSISSTKSTEPTHPACHQVGVKAHIPRQMVHQALLPKTATILTKVYPPLNSDLTTQLLHYVPPPSSQQPFLDSLLTTLSRSPYAYHNASFSAWMRTHILPIPLQAFVRTTHIDQRSSKGFMWSTASCFWTLLKAYLSTTSRSLLRRANLILPFRSHFYSASLSCLSKGK